MPHHHNLAVIAAQTEQLAQSAAAAKEARETGPQNATELQQQGLLEYTQPEELTAASLMELFTDDMQAAGLPITP